MSFKPDVHLTGRSVLAIHFTYNYLRIASFVRFLSHLIFGSLFGGAFFASILGIRIRKVNYMYKRMGNYEAYSS